MCVCVFNREAEKQEKKEAKRGDEASTRLVWSTAGFPLKKETLSQRGSVVLFWGQQTTTSTNNKQAGRVWSEDGLGFYE